MSARGINFFDEWLRDNLPTISGADVISVAEAIQKMFRDAKLRGIGSEEIEVETGSVYERVVDAIVHYVPELPK
ncbi:DUF768 domain-containing protein [Mesorhizobium loti]|uniref:DUF768 domain-containing protein n=1 Tax=Mesorhizobium loti R88b TaxID=935548 RepID=A0A6M7WW81_RHILI|nr:DUF768 domain-containing protein [Mesorhizobium loti]QKD06447.1 DUF768 domain-containing protein [Mesorhizobium loti R88b]